MATNVKAFGQIADIINSSSITVDEVGDTDALVKKLQQLYPLLIKSKYAVAINRKVIHGNTVLEQDAEVAILPPFSGG